MNDVDVFRDNELLPPELIKQRLDRDQVKRIEASDTGIEVH